MAVNMKLGIDVSAFKSGITQANAQLKTFDAELKFAETTLKKTGDAEAALSQKTESLNKKLNVQKDVVKQYEKALEDMRKNNVDPMSASYQKMAAAMLNAQSAANETEIQLRELNSTQQVTATTADKLTQSMNGIDKKISLEQVRSGIKSITDGLESAAEKAIQFGEKLFSVIMESAQQADDIGTMAERLGLTEKEIQQINHNAERFEVTAEQLGTTWKKVKKNMASDNKEIVEGFAELGVQTHQIIPGKYENIIGEARDYKDVFWETGEALLKMTDASKQEALAQKLLGRSWDELLPLFNKGREVYEEALEKAPTASDEAINNLADLNARMAELESSWNTLKLEALGAIAPALEKGADAIANLLDKVTAYLQTDAGQELLERLGTAVSGLFDDLAKISPEDVVNNVTSVLTGLTSGLEWLSKNWEGVKNALIWIVGGWATLKIGGGILDIVKVVGGLAELTGVKAAGEAAGAAWGGAFAKAVIAAAPWLVGLIALLTPSGTGNDDLVDANGNLTEVGQQLENERIAEEERLANRTDRERWLDEMAGKYNGTMGISAVNMMMFGHDPIYEAIQDYWDKYRTGTATTEDWQYLQGAMDSNKWEQFMQVAKFMYSLDSAVEDLPDEAFGFNESFDEWLKNNENGVPIVIDPVVPEGTAGAIAEEVGPVLLPVQLVVQELTDEEAAELFKPKANGMPFVPYDGYLAMLHKGERVMTASQNRNYTYNSNTYFGSVNLNNGLQVDALAESIARNNRRKNRGYGS